MMRIHRLFVARVRVTNHTLDTREGIPTMSANPSAIEITLTVRIPETRPLVFHTLLVVHRAVRMLGTWRARARQRRALLQLDDRLLKDIGIARSTRDAECAKPRWCA